MVKLWYIPLEHLDKRYTRMMDKQIIRELKKSKIKYERIYGEELTSTIETGFFLDAIGTNYFKASQIMKIMKLFQDKKIGKNDVFFFSDLWFPGIESIKYVTSFLGYDSVKITGIMHAGSWTETDDVRTYMKFWAKYSEIGWFRLVNKVFLGSKHHKKEINNRNRCRDNKKLAVTGLAFSIADIYKIAKPLPWKERDNTVVFPHRIHWEKQPKVFDKFMKKHPELKAVKTMEHNLSKEDYFKLLAKSKYAFSSALQENFGYGMFEATVLGCAPIVPDRLAYKEYYHYKYRYKTIDEAHRIINRYKKRGYIPIDMTALDKGIPNMIKIIKEEYLK